MTVYGYAKWYHHSAHADWLSHRHFQIQTKFTPNVDDDREPFLSEQESLLEERINKSIQQSLASFRTHIDILFLHTPFPTGAENLRAWRTFESYVPHQVRHLGVSNASLQFLQGLYQRVLIKPEIVQNRFWAAAGFDVDLREFAAGKGIVYQGYGMLRFCDQLLKSRVVLDLTAKLGVKVELALYVLVVRLGNFSILNGTSNETHMEEDLSIMERVWVDVELREELQEYSVRFDDHLRLLIAEGK